MKYLRKYNIFESAKFIDIEEIQDVFQDIKDLGFKVTIEEGDGEEEFELEEEEEIYEDSYVTSYVIIRELDTITLTEGNPYDTNTIDTDQFLRSMKTKQNKTNEFYTLLSDAIKRLEKIGLVINYVKVTLPGTEISITSKK